MREAMALIFLWKVDFVKHTIVDILVEFDKYRFRDRSNLQSDYETSRQRAV